MSKPAKWLLIAVLALMIHLKLLNFITADLSPFQSYASMRRYVFPFGNVNYRELIAYAAVEWILLIIVALVFAFFLLRGERQ